jgi:hypothetical protein
MSQMRKWGIHFDGKDPWGFLERITELKEAYEYTDRQILAGLPELLKGDALLWFRNTRDTWDTWADFLSTFRDTYLPPRYRAHLLDEIHARTQKPGETCLKYATTVLSLMRRAGGFTREEQVDRLYRNLLPDYQLYIRRSEIRNSASLLNAAAEFEEIQERRRTLAEKTKPREAPITAATYDRAECCWRCKQRGHTRFECRRLPRRFCSQCGKDGVLTRECHPPTGNEARAGEAQATSRPTE